jgi:PncC family amidohydrolase
MVTLIDILASDVVQLLWQNNKKVAFAESCTGGLLSAAITTVPGSSKVFDVAVCAYANSIKSSLLGVEDSVLKTKGAVSSETAIQMANGIRKLANADYGISVTGIAGPEGGTDEKPVGTVYIGCSTEEKTTFLHLKIDTKDIPADDRRDWIRKETVTQALVLLRDTITST